MYAQPMKKALPGLLLLRTHTITVTQRPRLCTYVHTMVQNRQFGELSGFRHYTYAVKHVKT